MTDDDRKRIAEYLGECWNPFPTGSNTICSQSNRTFTTWPDLGAVKEKLVERGKFRQFLTYAETRFDANAQSVRLDYPMYGIDDAVNFMAWLFTPSRFCSLVAEWLKEGKG